MGIFHYFMKKDDVGKQPDRYMVETRIFTKAFVERFTYLMMKSEAIWTQMVSVEESISYHTLEQYLFELDLAAFTHASTKLFSCVGRDRTWTENHKTVEYFDYFLVMLYQYIENQSSDLRNRDCKLMYLQKMKKVRNYIVNVAYDQFINDSSYEVVPKFDIPKLENMTYFIPKRVVYDVGIKSNGYLNYVEKILDPEIVGPMVLESLEQPKEKKLVL